MFDVGHTIRFLPIHVIDPRVSKEESLFIGEELESLIKTLGGSIVDRVMQRLDRPDNRTFIGRGKAVEVAEKIKEEDIDVVVLSQMAKPMQVHALKTQFQKVNPKIEVWDRVDLILQIFEKHAKTVEAKLQIELARMNYMGPRIYGMGYVMSRQGGGIGTLGVGETNTELMKRHWRDSVKRVHDELEKISNTREQQIERRKKSGFKTISIVGYTNAGKSSLFNLLAGKDVLVENALFATLDSTVGKLYLQSIKQEVLITDTIGFIRDLPPRLMSAFKSTLLESIHADVLLHVIDVSDPELEIKIEVVNEILQELGRDSQDVVYVFNKVDAARSLNLEVIEEKFKSHAPIFISVKEKSGIENLINVMTTRLRE